MVAGVPQLLIEMSVDKRGLDEAAEAVAPGPVILVPPSVQSRARRQMA